jgi:hypothetical protein
MSDENILDIILFNTNLKVDSIAKLSTLNREWNTNANDYLDYLYSNFKNQIVYKNGQEFTELHTNINKTDCYNCGKSTTKYDVFLKSPRCTDCRNNNLTYTDVKNNYKFTPTDFKNIDSLNIYNNAYRSRMTLYSKKDVIGYARIKYGKYGLQIKRHTGAAKEKREEKLNDILQKYIKNPNNITMVKSFDICTEFLQNGGAGIRKLTKDISKWVEYSEFLSGFTDSNLAITYEEHNKYYRHYLDDNIDILKNLYNKKVLYNTNFKILQNHNIDYHDNKKICDKFLNGNIETIEEVIHEIKCLNFLNNNTKYKSILKEILDERFANGKDMIYDIYGYIDNHQEYLNVLFSYVNEDWCESNAKKRALQNCDNLPDWFKIV